MRSIHRFALMCRIGANNVPAPIRLGLVYAGLNLAAEAESTCKPLVAVDPGNALPCVRQAAALRQAATSQKDSVALDVAEAQISGRQSDGCTIERKSCT